MRQLIEGSASQWLTQVTYPGMKWMEIKELFLQKYETDESLAAMFFNLFNSRPNDSECHAIYASRLVTSLTTKWRKMNIEEIAVSTVLTHMANVDGRLQRLVFTSNVQTRSKLQSELNAFQVEKKRNVNREENSGPDYKRRKTSSVLCHFCGKPGHRAFECRAKMRQSGETMKPLREKPNVTCFRCGM